jgi:thiol-disulfide isomerase/thioredoxin
VKKSNLLQIWNRYRQAKRWWSILFDFLFLVLIIAMLIPATRKPLSAFVVRNTLLSPRESSKTLFLDDHDWAFTVVDYEGNPLELGELRGKPILINFWATWCPPCIAELPSIQKLYDKYQSQVNFIFISNESPEEVMRFMKKKNYSFPLYALSGPVPETFESSTIPATYLVSAGGRLILRKTGAAKWDSKKMFRLMDRLIQEETPVQP